MSPTSSPQPSINGESEDAPDSDLTRTESMRSAADRFSPIHELVFVLVVCMAQFMTQAALGACLAPLAIIGDGLNISQPGILSWLIAGYSLTVGTFILFFGRLGDLFGYRLMFIIGFLWFALWSMVAGVSVYSNYILFIFARTLQGLGPAMLLPNGLAILGATYRPGRKKHMVFSLFGAMAPNGSVIAAIIAAVFAQLAWWPWIWWSMALWCFLLAILGIYAIPPTPTPARIRTLSARELCSEMDLLGATLGITGLVLVNIAWNQAPVVGWSQPYVYSLLLVGLLILAGFLTWETRFARHPLIPFHALTPDVSFILACVACGWASFGIWIYYFWRFLEDIRGISPIVASVQFLPPAITGIIAAFSTGHLLSKLHPGWIMVIAMAAFTLGNVLSAITPVHQTYWALSFVTLLIIPFGMDMSFPAATVVLSDAVGKEHQGVAASLVCTIVNYSISLGLGFAGTVEVHVNHGAETFHDTLVGYRGAFYMGIGLGGLGLVTSLVYVVHAVGRGKQRERREVKEGTGDA
ncbi:MFS transporter [Aspergillus saccharolyticus JOP 1030-1]|uniref:MFS general substrate transporter n=1 Tax=Aspergillus saccharolyticus JOP 1030-1 TaxID=1450539 RepID=A0A318ZHH3_9EURO|nr:MFS general substrate transporter [Aspergillus saccharolyticus JOP 1030-1]PYH47021.1 MFS general substrate transporter [Aspergillus saccharolyticus JOP 1030-1]